MDPKSEYGTSRWGDTGARAEGWIQARHARRQQRRSEDGSVGRVEGGFERGARSRCGGRGCRHVNVHGDDRDDRDQQGDAERRGPKRVVVRSRVAAHQFRLLVHHITVTRDMRRISKYWCYANTVLVQ